MRVNHQPPGDHVAVVVEGASVAFYSFVGPVVGCKEAHSKANEAAAVHRTLDTWSLHR